MNTLPVVLSIFMVFSLAFAATEAKLEITKLTRDIYLKGKYVRISYEIELHNNGPVPTKKYLHSIDPKNVDYLIDALAFTKDYAELPIMKEPNTTGFAVDLSTSLQVGKKVTIKVLELYKNRLVPKPARLALSSVFALCISPLFHIGRTKSRVHR